VQVWRFWHSRSCLYYRYTIHCQRFYGHTDAHAHTDAYAYTHAHRHTHTAKYTDADANLNP
jgi:hypothetical protein